MPHNPFHIPDYGMGRWASKKRMEDRSLNSAAIRSSFNTDFAPATPQVLPKQPQYNIDPYSGKGQDSLSFGTGLNLFHKSQANTAEQSGDTAGPPSGEAAGAMLEGFLKAIAKHQASRSQPTKGESFHPAQPLPEYDPNATLA